MVEKDLKAVGRHGVKRLPDPSLALDRHARDPDRIATYVYLNRVAVELRTPVPP